MSRKTTSGEPVSPVLVAPPSGHVYLIHRQSGPVWYAKYRTGTGRQIQRKLGPAWTRRGAPPDGYLNRTLAERRLCATLAQIRARTMPPLAGTPATLAAAATEWIRYIEHDRHRRPNTIRAYDSMLRTHVLPEFGQQLLTDITASEIERWAWSIDCAPTTRAKLIVCVGGIYHRARKIWGITYDPVKRRRTPDAEAKL